MAKGKLPKERRAYIAGIKFESHRDEIITLPWFANDKELTPEQIEHNAAHEAKAIKYADKYMCHKYYANKELTDLIYYSIMLNEEYTFEEEFAEEDEEITDELFEKWENILIKQYQAREINIEYPKMNTPHQNYQLLCEIRSTKRRYYNVINDALNSANG